jgi:hypothetical protein
MKRSMCGLIVLAAVTVLWSCKGDPIDPSGERILADPSSLFLDQGASEFVVVQMVDNQGNQLAADFEPQSVGPGITVEKDTTFLQTTIGTTLETRERFIVTGTAPTASSFQVTSRGQTLTIPVKVTPIGVAVTLSNPAPAANEGLVITLPAGYKFGAGAGANVSGTAGIVQAVAPDSSSITVLLPPGTTGTITVDNVAVDFAPGVLFSLPTESAVTVGAVTPLAGTGSPGTAPAVTIPAVGGTTTFFDGGTYDYAAPIFGGAFGTFPSRLYNVTFADSTTLTVTVDWPSPEDLGIYLFESNGTTEVGSPGAGDAGGGGVHPETLTQTFGPGTFLVAIVNFNATNPPYIALSITNEPPAE